MRPLVSVIMPAYNGEKYIGEAIESILNQTYDNFEFIIVEDKSTDGTLSVIQQYSDSRICLIQNSENRGIAYSTNLGMSKSRGKYIALLDDDDMATKQRLEWQVAFLEEHEDIDVLGGRSVMIDKDGRFIKYDKEPIYNSDYIKANLLFNNNKFANCTVMFRKDFVESNNIKYQDNCLGMQDFRFYIDCAKVGRITSIDHLVHLKRIHEEEETVKRRKTHAAERAALFARFQRESIEMSGFRLDEEELQTINDIITELPKETYSGEEVLRLYKVFKEMIRQAREMEIDYLPGLEYACKKILGDRILTRANIFD